MMARSAFRLAALVALVLLVACSPPARPVPPATGDTAPSAPRLLVTSLAGSVATPPRETIRYAVAGDTVVVTQYWSPAKGSGTTMIVTAGVNGKSIKDSAEVAYTAGRGTVRLPGARPAPGDSVSLWRCMNARNPVGVGTPACGSVWFKVKVVTPPPVTPPLDSTVVAIEVVPGPAVTVASKQGVQFCAFCQLKSGQWALGVPAATGVPFPARARCDSIGLARYTVRWSSRTVLRLRMTTLASR